MRVVFNQAVILEAYVGTSQKGNQFGKLRFLSDDLDVYEIFCSPEFVAPLKELPVKSTVDLAFDLQPAREGGVRLVGVN